MQELLHPGNRRPNRHVEYRGGSVFCNPPYGRALGAWVRKAYEEAQAGTTVVLLIPARTDTAYFHDYIYGKAEIRFLRGRLHFEDEDGNRFPPAPFPSMQSMLKEQEKQGERLEALEGRDGEKWRKVMGYIATAIVGVVLGYLFKQIGL